MYNDVGYTGNFEEAALGISDFGARCWYDPRIGRFLAIDPAGVDPANPQSFNRYAYANDNPYKYVDPDGQVGLLIRAFQRGLSLNNASIISGAGNGALATLPAIYGAAARLGRAADKVDVAKSATPVGQKVYRVWGDGADSSGRSWTRTDPSTPYRCINFRCWVTSGGFQSPQVMQQLDPISGCGLQLRPALVVKRRAAAFAARRFRPRG